METMQQINGPSSTKALARRAMGLYLCLLLLAFILTGAVVLGWRPASPNKLPPLGATVWQCDSALGGPVLTGSDMDDLHRWSCLYSTRGWNIIVSFDEQKKAEQFIFCKLRLPTLEPPKMSDTEQRTLLENYKGSSTWPAPENKNFGPVWIRTDNQAYASYIAARHWLVFMNQSGMDKYLKSLNLKIYN